MNKWQGASICLLFSQAVIAGEWEISPSVSLEERYTDNVNQAANNEQSDLITRVTPAISITGEGRRLQMSFDYQITAQKSKEGGEADQISQQLNATATSELWKRAIFLDVASTISQQAVNNNDDNVNDNLLVNEDGNVDNVYTFEVSPFFLHHIGPYVDTESRVRLNEVINDSDQANNSTSFSTSFTATSGPRFAILPWEFSIESQTISEDDAEEDTEFTTANLRVNYNFNQTYGVFATIGYEDNNFDSNDQNVEQNSGSWSAGVTWNPSSRTSLEASIGKESFGETFSLDFQHRRRQSNWTIQYSEDLTNSREQQLEVNPIQQIQNGQPVIVNVPQSSLVDEVFVNKSFTVGVGLQTRKTTLDFQLFHNTRSFQVNVQDETSFGLSTNVSRRLSPRTNANLSYSWQKTAFRDEVNDGEDVTWDIGLGFDRQFTANSNVSLQYNHLVREADDANDEFVENNITLNWRLTIR